MTCPQGLGLEALKKKAEDMWNQIVKLETEKYDLEERQKRQDYDVRIADRKPRQKTQIHICKFIKMPILIP